tara:strand:+ start:595 stop:1038 length:444 start_codon:yes stop_codon:yes gene_type:complete
METQKGNEKIQQTALTAKEQVAKMKHRKELMKKREEERKQELVAVVMRQTDYNEEQSREKLEQNKYDVSETIREYMKPDKITNVNDTSPPVVKSTNQMIYGEFRKLLDDAASNHRREKENEERRIQYMQNLQQKRAAAMKSMKKNIE